MTESTSPVRASIASIESSRPSQRSRSEGGGSNSGSVAVGREVPHRSPEAKQVDAETTAQLATQLAAALETVEGEFSVSVDGDTGMIVVRITDQVTGEIVKQIPPQELVDADLNMERIIGLLVDNEA